jgi:hypothetical protein
MLQYDPICEQILRTERLLLQLKREYEGRHGEDRPPSRPADQYPRPVTRPRQLSMAHRR